MSTGNMSEEDHLFRPPNRRSLITRCDQCVNQVSATEVQHLLYQDGDAAPIWRFSMLQCDSCGNPMVVYEEDSPIGFDDPIWLHPAPPPEVSPLVPIQIRREIEEARSCLRHGLFTAAAVMAGRAVEGIAQAYEINNKTLHGAIEELGHRRILDGRFQEWANHLRVLRNQAAHFTGSQVDKEDAEDVVALVEAIVTYIFVFTRRFDEFSERRGLGSSRNTGEGSG
jgi:hypothetical protein